MTLNFFQLSQIARECLHQSGWSEDSRFDSDVFAKSRIDDNMHVSSHAVEVWQRFGPLCLSYPNRRSRNSFYEWRFFEGPTRVSPFDCEMYENVLGVPFTFLGVDGEDGRMIYIDAMGAVYSADLLNGGVLLRYGDNMIEALNNLCEFDAPAEILVPEIVINEQRKLRMEEGLSEQMEQIRAKVFWKFYENDRKGDSEK